MQQTVPPQCVGCKKTGAALDDCRIRVYTFHAIRREKCPQENGGAWAPKPPIPVVKQAPDIRSIPPIPVKLGYYEKFPVSLILSAPFTLRLNIQEDIQELIEQISTTKTGEEHAVILQPLVCRPAKTPGYIEVSAGERRLLAAKTLGLGVIPVVIKNFTDEEFDRTRLIENVARKDLSDYELARYIQYLMEKYPRIYPTQANVADVFGKSREWVTNHLRMLQLEKTNIVSRETMEKITEGQARAILSVPQEKQKEIAAQIEKEARIPTVREISSKPEIEVPSPEPSTSDTLSASEESLRKPEQPEVPSEPEVTEHEEPKPEVFIDIGEFECSECHVKFHVKHIAPNLHRLELVRKL